MARDVATARGAGTLPRTAFVTVGAARSIPMRGASGGRQRPWPRLQFGVAVQRVAASSPPLDGPLQRMRADVGLAAIYRDHELALAAEARHADYTAIKAQKAFHLLTCNCILWLALK